MITEPLSDEGQSYDLSGYDKVGFHATATTASAEIERVGFLPHKILDAKEHDRLLRIASGLGLETDFYEQWLAMRSVTFTKTVDEAVAHVGCGKAGGQGLGNIDRLLTRIGETKSTSDETFVMAIQGQLQAIRNSDSIIYVVDLSELEPRLVDKPPGDFYQYYWDPSADLPVVSEIDPSRLVAKLTLPPSISDD